MPEKCKRSVRKLSNIILVGRKEIPVGKKSSTPMEEGLRSTTKKCKWSQKKENQS